MIVLNNRFNLYVMKKLIKLFYLHCSCKKVVKKSNKKNLKVIKNTLPNKSEQLKISSTNVLIVGEDLLRAF